MPLAWLSAMRLVVSVLACVAWVGVLIPALAASSRVDLEGGVFGAAVATPSDGKAGPLGIERGSAALTDFVATETDATRVGPDGHFAFLHERHGLHLRSFRAGELELADHLPASAAIAARARARAPPFGA